MYKKLFCLLVVLAIAVPASADLVAMYTFGDAVSGPVTTNLGGAGAAADGILMNGASIVDLDPDERGVEYVLNLNYGDGTIHQFMDIGGGGSAGWANWNGEAGQKQPLSISAWVYKTPGTWGNWRTIMSQGYEKSWALCTGTPNGAGEDLIAFSAHQAPSSWSPLTGTVPMEDGYWHFVVGTVEDADFKTSKLYIDGVLQSSVQMWQGVNYSAFDAYVGYDQAKEVDTDPVTRPNGWDFSWNGMLDNVAVYHSELTAPQVESLFYGTYSPFRPTIPEPTTIALLGLGGLVLLRRRR